MAGGAEAGRVEGRKEEPVYCWVVQGPGEISHSLIGLVIDTFYYNVLGVQTAWATGEAWALASPWFPLVSPPSYSKWNIQECSLIWVLTWSYIFMAPSDRVFEES